MWRDACDMRQQAQPQTYRPSMLDPETIRSSQHLFFLCSIRRPTPAGQDLAMLPHARSIAIAIGNVRATTVCHDLCL